MGHLLFGHVMADYASCGQSLIAVAQLALGESNYYELEAASGPIAAGIYYWTFMLTITIVFVNMVLAILFSTYDTLQEAISEAEEIPLGGFMLRAVLLGREPSLYEQQLDIYAVVKSTSTFRLLGLGDGARHRGVRVAPSLPVGADARGGRSESFAAAVEAGTLTSKTFAESHLLKLLDPDYSYRLFGALSNKTDNKLLLAKAQVLELRTSEAFSMRRTSVAVQMKAQQENFEAAAKAAQTRHEATVAGLAEEPDGEDDLASEEEKFKDKRITLDVDEFCALLHMLDDDSFDIDIGQRSAQAEAFKLGERSDEMRISEMVFEQFARPAEQNTELHFRKLVAEEFRQIRQAHGKHAYRQEEALKRMCKALQVEFPAATDEHSNPRQGGGKGSVVAPPPASRMVPQQAPRQAPPPLHRESSESSFTTM
uniref:Polycystin cation channel PKD1/PKD2 domain-containing protein n=1 Tax=Florenciella parvula TaxID=236787 RepID=A0A7S2AVB2_9STRA|mmetsp:Transcript_1004/g.2475  ORF Transcript_1004/g.2475 Transcript_1004/m.2475 type:complete len:426 (+) Transcript_1004:3-1280(+)